MGAIQNIFARSAPEYLHRYESRIPKNHIKALKAIISCRTSACGLVVYDCTGCGRIHVGFRSCGNRHCPICQYHKTRQWLDRQLERQLPGHHFLITFSWGRDLPSRLNESVHLSNHAWGSENNGPKKNPNLRQSQFARNAGQTSSSDVTSTISALYRCLILGLDRPST